MSLGRAKTWRYLREINASKCREYEPVHLICAQNLKEEHFVDPAVKLALHSISIETIQLRPKVKVTILGSWCI